uniref:Uncharacterized protein n=1 Tax=Panagrolaimus sp. JU765 TaxID=591449 RepID=A0AC34Q5U7_9BILA
MSWARSLIGFVPGLSTDEQAQAIANSVSKLFLLSAVEDQFINSTVLAENSEVKSQIFPETRSKLQSLLNQIEVLHFDLTEFNVLRVLTLLRGVSEKTSQVMQLVHLNLLNHQQLNYPYQPARYPQSMIVLDLVSSINCNELLAALKLMKTSANTENNFASIASLVGGLSPAPSTSRNSIQDGSEMDHTGSVSPSVSVSPVQSVSQNMDQKFDLESINLENL